MEDVYPLQGRSQGLEGERKRGRGRSLLVPLGNYRGIRGVVGVFPLLNTIVTVLKSRSNEFTEVGFYLHTERIGFLWCSLEVGPFT